MVDPLGIDNVTPHLSWKLKGDGVVDGQAFLRNSGSVR